jgi:methyl-accepting chemotaxis protein
MFADSTLFSHWQSTGIAQDMQVAARTNSEVGEARRMRQRARTTLCRCGQAHQFADHQFAGEVSSGAGLVREAGQPMTRIVGSVREVSQTIGETMASAEAQSAAIEEVGNAMNQLDEMTQQNAARVEQSSAAARSLEMQAQRLTSVVSAFRLEGAADATRGS